MNDTYKIALSFAMEDKEVVENVYHYLKAEGNSVFYAPMAECQAVLSGKNQREIFYEVFGLKAEYVALFVSASYIAKKVPMEEARIAIAKHSKDGSVIPIYLDGTPLPDELFDSHNTNYFKSRNSAEIAAHLAARIKSVTDENADATSNFKSKNIMNVIDNRAEKQIFIQTLEGSIEL